MVGGIRKISSAKIGLEMTACLGNWRINDVCVVRERIVHGNLIDGNENC